MGRWEKGDWWKLGAGDGGGRAAAPFSFDYDFSTQELGDNLRSMPPVAAGPTLVVPGAAPAAIGFVGPPSLASSNNIDEFVPITRTDVESGDVIRVVLAQPISQGQDVLIADDQGNTYTPLPNPLFDAVRDVVLSGWYAVASESGSVTVTVHFFNGGIMAGLCLDLIRGADPANPLTDQVGATTTVVGVDTLSSGTMVPDSSYSAWLIDGLCYSSSFAPPANESEGFVNRGAGWDFFGQDTMRSESAVITLLQPTLEAVFASTETGTFDVFGMVWNQANTPSLLGPSVVSHLEKHWALFDTEANGGAGNILAGSFRSYGAIPNRRPAMVQFLVMDTTWQSPPPDVGTSSYMGGICAAAAVPRTGSNEWPYLAAVSAQGAGDDFGYVIPEYEALDGVEDALTVVDGPRVVAIVTTKARTWDVYTRSNGAATVKTSGYPDPEEPPTVNVPFDTIVMGSGDVVAAMGDARWTGFGFAGWLGEWIFSTEPMTEAEVLSTVDALAAKWGIT